jgi:Rrf2 family protein
MPVRRRMHRPVRRPMWRAVVPSPAVPPVGRVMRISARTEYALRAMVALAADDGLVHAEKIAAEQDIPRRFCDNILLHLRRAGLLWSRRGPEGGYRLARPAHEITLAEVIRVTEGVEPPAARFPGAAAPLAAIWERLYDHENALLSEITLADVVGSGREVTAGAGGPAAKAAAGAGEEAGAVPGR